MTDDIDETLYLSIDSVVEHMRKTSIDRDKWYRLSMRIKFNDNTAHILQPCLTLDEDVRVYGDRR